MIAEAFASLIPTARRHVNASLENPVYSLNDPALYELLSEGYKSAAGVTVTHESALSLAAVYQAVSLISGDVCKLPIYPYKRTRDDDREIDTRHAAYIPVAVRANRQKSARLLWRDTMVHGLLWGNGYDYIDRSGGKIELLNLLPDRTAPEWVKIEDKTKASGFRYEFIYVTEVGGKLEPIQPRDILHIRGISIDGTVGCDLVRHARDAWGLALAAQNFASKFFKNGARIGGILELPAGMGKTARDTVEEGFRSSYEDGENPFKTVILRDNAKFHAAQVTPEQGQVTDIRDTQKREVASFFNLPPSKLGVKDSVSYNSFEQDGLAYLHGCLHHWLGTIADECNMKLLSERELLTDTHYFEHNVSKFVEADWKTMNEALEIQRRNEVINANEWRRKINLNKRTDAGGEDYTNPNVKSAAASAPAAKPDKTAHRELFIDTVNRMARRVSFDAKTAAKTPGKFMAWLDGGAQEHKNVFDDAVRPVAKAYASVFGGSMETICTQAQEAFFNVLIPELSAFTEPPYPATELQANVTKTMDHFERTAGERITTTILETDDE